MTLCDRVARPTSRGIIVTGTASSTPTERAPTTLYYNYNHHHHLHRYVVYKSTFSPYDRVIACGTEGELCNIGSGL